MINVIDVINTIRMRADLSEHMLNLGYFEVWIRLYPSSEQHHAHTWYTCTHELKKFVGVTELQKSCGYTGTTHEPEGLLYVRSMSKAKSVGIRNGKPIVNHIIYRFSSSKANICIHFEECLKNVKFFTHGNWTIFTTLVGGYTGLILVLILTYRMPHCSQASTFFLTAVSSNLLVIRDGI